MYIYIYTYIYIYVYIYIYIYVYVYIYIYIYIYIKYVHMRRACADGLRGVRDLRRRPGPAPRAAGVLRHSDNPVLVV